MKKLLALLLVFPLLLSGCAVTDEYTPEPSATQESPQESTEETETSAVPEKEEDGKLGLSYYPAQGLNPFTCKVVTNRALFSLLYEGLFVVSNEFRAEPVLCESFRVSEDGKTYSFTLLEGLLFSDGTPVTAADVEASIGAARQSPMYRSRLSDVSYYVADGDRTIVVQLYTAYENFALMMDIPILKKDTIESDSPVGTGAYKAQGMSLARNTNWWQTEAPMVDEEIITLNVCQDINDLRDSFEFGGTDLVYCDPNSAAAVGFRCDYETWEAPTTIMHYIGFNLYSGYFVNDTLRRAVTHIIDREDIGNKVYGGFGVASVLPCSPHSDLYDSQLAENYDYAPASFIEALEASGVKTSAEYANHVGLFIVSADDPARIEAAEYICQVLQDYGLNIRVNILDADSYKDALEGGDFDLYYGEVRLPNSFDLTEFFQDGGNLEYGSISSSTLEDLCQEALENSGRYVDLCSQVMQQGRICPVIFKSYAVNVTRGLMTDLTPSMDCVFHDASTARTLADADKTYASE